MISSTGHLLDGERREEGGGGVGWGRCILIFLHIISRGPVLATAY